MPRKFIINKKTKIYIRLYSDTGYENVFIQSRSDLLFFFMVKNVATSGERFVFLTIRQCVELYFYVL